ncbi:hypothetical protein [Pseudarthrobacter raffinosi]|uniref:hypothetical protein n=1 Tax=Pseudarthrobacter raffinosi TaxID=2953651 RepID=UPI00208F8202|nr:hypothetical protein [Pseudarthrobacter sp. MDT3-9]MCO4253152.1 hypothetical protein [Pseudarthrobacter sp. MDT3-9]
MTFKQSDMVVLPLMFVAMFVLIAVAMSMGDSIAIFGAMAMPVMAWFVNRKVFNATYLSPTIIVCGFFTLIGIAGYALRQPLAALGGRGTSIALALSDEQNVSTLWLISGVATTTMLTAGMAMRMTQSRQAAGIEFRKFTWQAASPPAWLVLGAAVPLMVIVWNAGLPDLLARDRYLFADRGSVISAIGTPLATAMIVVLGYFFGSSRGGTRAASLMLLLGYTAVLFSFGSRRFALIPILFGVGLFLANNSKVSRLAVGVCAILTAALLPLPLMFRSSLNHGVLPYLTQWAQFSPADAEWLATLNNVMVAFPIIGASAFGLTQVDVSDLWVSLNPISGESAGWYEIAYKLRLNGNTPMAGIGELANVGWLPVALFSIAMGLVLSWVERAVRRHVVNGAQVYASLLLGLSGLFALQMVQYNLRSAVRLLVYLLILEVGRRVLVSIHHWLGRCKRQAPAVVAQRSSHLQRSAR